MSRTAGLVALVAGAISISLGAIAVKEAYAGGSQPQELLAARMLVAGILVAPTLPFALRGVGEIGGRAVAFAVVAGVLLWISSRAELEALARLPAGMVALLLATAPMWVAAIDWLGAGLVPSRFERRTMAAIVAGVAVMAAPIGSSIDSIGLLGGLLSAMTFAVFLFVLARNARVSAARAFPLGLVGAALVVLATDPKAVTTLGAGPSLPLILAVGASQAGWALLVGAGIGATNAVTAAMMVAVEPVLVAVLALAILQEGLSTRAIVGGAIVVGALAAVAVRLGLREHEA